MAMLVMTVGLLGLLQSVQSAYRQVLADRVREEAVLLAEEQMHDWRKEPFDEILANSKPSSTADRYIGGAVRRFQVQRESEATGALAGTPPTVRMKVSVSWTLRGATLSHAIYTLKTNR